MWVSQEIAGWELFVSSYIILMHQKDERHDWLGDAAESYVRYLFACEGFHVYGASKWHADIAAYDPKRKKWWRVEVKSTDRSAGKVFKKPLTNLFKKADIVVLVRFSHGKTSRLLHDKKIEVELVMRLAPKKYEKEFIGRRSGDIQSFLSTNRRQ